MKRFLIALIFALGAACAMEVKDLQQNVNEAILAGRNLPTWKIRGDSHQWVADVMVAILVEEEFTVLEAEEIKDLQGQSYVAVTKTLEREVVIRRDLSGNMRASTLIHEYAHTLAPLPLPNGEQEAWAEGIAFLVCKRLGLNTETESISYLANVSMFQREVIWGRWGGEMIEVADRLAERIRARRPTA